MKCSGLATDDEKRWFGGTNPRRYARVSGNGLIWQYREGARRLSAIALQRHDFPAQRWLSHSIEAAGVLLGTPASEKRIHCNVRSDSEGAQPVGLAPRCRQAALTPVVLAL
jgi:hypothetical protein